MEVKTIEEQAQSIRDSIKVITASKKSALKFLIATGVYDKKGKLTKQYGGKI
jgi:hypothetical protein